MNPKSLLLVLSTTSVLFVTIASVSMAAEKNQSVSISSVGEFGDQGFNLTSQNGKSTLQKLNNSHVLAEVALDPKSFHEIKNQMLELGKLMPKKKEKMCRNFIELATSFKKKKSQGCLTQNSELKTLYSKLIFDLNLKMAEQK